MKKWLKRNRGLVVFLLFFGLFRTAVADWNPIPSGSMRPTLLEGDVVLVDRLAYDAKVPLTDISLHHLADPQRGDVVTFSSPRDGTRLIKRLVGLPGDTVEMKNEVLYVNGKAAEYERTTSTTEVLGNGMEVEGLQAIEKVAGSDRNVQFLPRIQARRDFGPITVPADSYFMLGDNRDNSEDSRYIGVVPRQLLIGRAHHVLLSANILERWQPRWDRTVKKIR